jgi:hypothetical protein
MESKGQVHEDSDGNEDSIGNWLEIIHATFWQRTCLDFVHAMRHCRIMSLTVLD